MARPWSRTGRRYRAVIPCIGTLSPTPRGRRTRSARNGTRPSSRIRIPSTWRRRWPGTNGIAGVGIWALGMDGPNDQAMVSGSGRHAPALENGRPARRATSTSPSPVELAPLKVAAPSTSALGQPRRRQRRPRPRRRHPRRRSTPTGELARDETRVLRARSRAGAVSSRGDDRLRHRRPEPDVPRQRVGARRVLLRERPDAGLRHRPQGMRGLCQRCLRLVSNPHPDDRPDHGRPNPPTQPPAAATVLYTYAGTCLGRRLGCWRLPPSRARGTSMER